MKTWNCYKEGLRAWITPTVQASSESEAKRLCEQQHGFMPDRVEEQEGDRP